VRGKGAGLSKKLGTTVLALDPGSRRIGVAISDPTGKIALPVMVISRVGNGHMEQLSKLVVERSVDEVVVGLPKTLRGEEGSSAEEARAFVRELEERLNLPVHVFDERFTTVEAQTALRRGGMKEERQRSLVDKLAATLLLQSFLDARAAAQARR
jgi:putative Holliday junction resolvase